MISNSKAESVFFSQNLPQDSWTELPYWMTTVGNDGCGMVSLAMCIDLLTDADLTPADVYRIREDAGLNQHRVADKEGTSVCGGDVTLKLNTVNRRLFGIESRPLERTCAAFKRVLTADEPMVIWASSRKIPFHDVNGAPRYRRSDQGHVIVFWKYENGIYYAKDCAYTKELGNNVPYSEEQLKDWLAANSYQQFAISGSSE